MVGLDCSIIMNPKVWEASGHVGGFTDPLVDCTTCKGRFRADQIFTVRFLGEGDQPIHVAAGDQDAEDAEAPGAARQGQLQDPPPHRPG